MERVLNSVFGFIYFLFFFLQMGHNIFPDQWNEVPSCRTDFSPRCEQMTCE